MKNILARGGIEFLAVLLGISGSLWIDNNKKEADLELERKTVHEIIEREVDQIMAYTDERLAYYKKQDESNYYLFENWESFSSDSLEDPFQFTYNVFTTGTYMYSPNLSTFDALKSDGRFNLIDIGLRKSFGEFFMLLEYIKKIEDNENIARERLLAYINTNHSDVKYKYPIGPFNPNGKFENFLLILEHTRFDKSVWGHIDHKVGLTRSRNSRVKWVKDLLISIQNDLKKVNGV
ncbi:MAG: hypothetical protein H8E56_00475 [Candidatus Marinimicrobia bacterium]|nr:hypothetical protein [Candidatus Neomarinimicrobiota bacterium]